MWNWTTIVCILYLHLRHVLVVHSRHSPTLKIIEEAYEMWGCTNRSYSTDCMGGQNKNRILLIQYSSRMRPAICH